MKQNSQAHSQNLTVRDNLLMVTSSTSLTPKDRIVRAEITAAATITLANVSRMAGVMVCITLVSDTNDTLTISDGSESSGWSDIALTGHNDSVVLYSDGFRWNILASSSGIAKSADKSFYSSFNTPVIGHGKIGAAATGATGDENILLVDGVGLEYHILGTQTILAPSNAATGLSIGMDQTADDGVEINTGVLANIRRKFTVGTDGDFFVRCKFSIADVSGTDDCAVGFRKLEANQANIDDYDEMAVLNVISGNITIETILNGAATTSTDTTDDWADAETHTLEVKVSAAGVVTYLIDDVAPSTTAAFTFDDGEIVIPFIYFLNDTDLAGAVVLQELEFGQA